MDRTTAFQKFVSDANFEPQEDLVGLAIYWLSAYCGEEVVPHSEVHDFLNYHNFRINEKVVASRIKQLKNKALLYYDDRSGAPSGFQLTEKGLKKYDDISIRPNDIELTSILTTNIKTKLGNSKYGEEVVEHLSDGDECLRRGLLHPALNSYIHAIEWALIAYLELEANQDIIAEEQNNNTAYYFAGRPPNLLAEVQNHNSPLSQKNESWLKGRNRTERRWIAHHKSGSILESDIQNARARLGEILKELFP